jgi:S-formylglutathione hydrolase FrmB
VTSCKLAASILVADRAALLRHYIGDIALTHGWLPTMVQALTLVVLMCAIGWRTVRWRLVWLPIAALLGVAVAGWAHWYVGSVGVAGDPAPRILWIWLAVTGLAAAVFVIGWRVSSWWRRGLSMLVVPLCLLNCVLVLNEWVGYFPTVRVAWNQLTSGPLPDETDRLTVSAMQLTGATPTRGVVVPVTISADASRFRHRRELVYLPPAWFERNPPPRLPVLMMIGAEFNSPTDWLRAGDAVTTMDHFEAAHGGNAPVLVFVDSGGAFNVDTECVNGSRGNAADHLTRDVIPFMISDFGVSANRAHWGVAGFSAGGTCAVDLAVMHPDLFSTFEDIGGDLGPNTGTKAQTIDRLFGGNADAWAAFDPTTVITRHGSYVGMSGHFIVSGPPENRPATAAAAHEDARTLHTSNPGGPEGAADSLCVLGIAHGIACSVWVLPGKHDWPFAASAFGVGLPWVAGQLGTPDVPQLPPSTTTAAAISSARPHPGSVVQAAGK